MDGEQDIQNAKHFACERQLHGCNWLPASDAGLHSAAGLRRQASNNKPTIMRQENMNTIHRATNDYR